MILKTPWLLILIPLLLVFLFWQKKSREPPSLRFPDAGILSALPLTWKVRFSGLPFYLRLAAIVLFVIALAGPRQVLEETKHFVEGIDIVLAIDASGSMAAEDFQIEGKRFNRLYVVKKVVDGFIDARQNDRIGLVIFAGRAYTASPLTTDHNWLKSNLDRIELNVLEDGTAIGSGIMSSLSRFKQSKAKSKIIVLLTDGVNNAGDTEPLVAAKTAEAMGIKVYTIGAGTDGYAPYPGQDIWGRQVYRQALVQIDEETLQQIAQQTRAHYFRAKDTDQLKAIYKEIDQLEKTKIEEFGYRQYKELFVYALSAALALLILEMILSQTILLKVP